MPDLVNGHQPEHSSVGGFQLAVQRRPGGLNPKSFGHPEHMTRPEDLTADQHAIVDQSDDVRDPADDSDEMNDPTKMTDTYPEALDPKLQEAKGPSSSPVGARRPQHPGSVAPAARRHRASVAPEPHGQPPRASRTDESGLVSRGIAAGPCARRPVDDGRPCRGKALRGAPTGGRVVPLTRRDAAAVNGSGAHSSYL